ncbi:hypothetical protein GF412_01545 [Candidatus Micrarchaeota archaeon]|nr:hypothetical protein [Candidatus Micrarchaeota archaeon]MBD3417651.1 hypothetical protein [Candidatus Micrarchaeota archaeon]
MVAVKRKNKKLLSVPKKAVSSSADYTLDSIMRSLEMAESADNHYRYAVHAQKDYNLTNKWESLPIYHHGDHLPKMELFKNFKRTVNKVL